MVHKQFWVVLPVDAVLQLEELQLSPLGVVPQHKRQPRVICDYTYYGVNQDTEPTAPPEAMQFGHALPRILFHLAHSNPAYGPVYVGKFDLADGFYRIPLAPKSSAPLVVLLLQQKGHPQLVALPLTMTMGWMESPPAFLGATETIANLANSRLIWYLSFPRH